MYRKKSVVIENFSKHLKMIKRRYLKKGIVTLLVTGLLMMTRALSIKTRHSEKVSNNLDQYFPESDLEAHITSKFKSSVLKNELSTHSKSVLIRPHGSSFQVPSCGYDYCPKIKKNFINIHLVPHSHNDPGYKKTMDEYFYGLRNDLHPGNISKIISNVIHQLTLNKDRKFIYVEVVYFSKWWKLQNESTRETVRDLVQKGRFEFLNGGWCVNDEATTNYADIIDQMSLGLNFLAETFGKCGRPKVLFQGDTFGHSREQALLSSLMGYDALFLGRVNLEEKTRREDENELEMIWSGNRFPGAQSSIFTGITYRMFGPFPGFCFENNCGDEIITKDINDDVESDGYNVKELVDEFLNQCEYQATAFRTNNIAVYMGSDNTYEDAEIWFRNMDKLIKYINERQQTGSVFNVFYSTPGCYVKALNEANVMWPMKKDDFFPYHTDIYWAGYYSSRPALKYMVRQGSSLLQACKQMASILKLKDVENGGDLTTMKEAMAILQHHDGITGTHSQRVYEDYLRILRKGVNECTKTINSYYNAELSRNEEVKKFEFSVSYCHQLNISQCWVSEQKGKSFVINIYNSLGKYIDKYIRVPVTHEHIQRFYNFRVIDSNGQILPSQLMPIPSFVASIPGRNSSADHELIFLATKIPPAGSKSYYILVSMSRKSRNQPVPNYQWSSLNHSSQTTELKISNKKLSLVLSKATGFVTSLYILGRRKIPLDQQFYWYNGNSGNLSAKSAGSGVYSFNPLNNTALPITNNFKNITVYKGDLVEEIHQTFNDYVGQIIRIYKECDYIEFDWVIGPIPIEDGIGKEIITRYSTDFFNNGQFYTDSNGRQSILRTRNKTQNDPVASNYYPITSHVYISDNKSRYRMSVISDRAQGGGSIADGQIELLIHRRHVQQDIYVFGEPLDEMAYGKGLVVRGTHTLLFEDTKQREMNNKRGSSTLRSIVHERSRQPTISFIPLNYTSNQWIKSFNGLKLVLLSRPLPENVKLLTFEPRPEHKGQYILRLEHIYDVGEHEFFSRPAEISLKGLFKGFTIEEISETTLDGNMMKSDLRRLKWKSQDNDFDSNFDHHTPPISLTSRIKLKPMEIRTFIIQLSKL